MELVEFVVDDIWLVAPVLSPLVLMYRALLVPRLTQEAQTDSKTGLLNAGYFNQRFAEAMENAQRLEQPLALVNQFVVYICLIEELHLREPHVLRRKMQIVQDVGPRHCLWVRRAFRFDARRVGARVSSHCRPLLL